MNGEDIEDITATSAAGSRDRFSDPLPGVPRVESPFFREQFARMAVDPETMRIAESLNQTGFASFDFPTANFAALADTIKRELAARCDWSGWRAGRDEELRVTDAWTWCPGVRRLATDGWVLNLLSQLYGRTARPFQTLDFPVGTQQTAHSDSVHFSSIPERFMCGVWVALEDVHEDAGPLIYYPGSHKWPIYTNEHIGHFVSEAAGIPSQVAFHRLWRELVRIHRVEPVRFLPKQGQAAIWAANLLHGGAAHRDRSRTRWSQVTHYFFADCAYFTPLESDPAYGRIRYREPIDIATGATMKSTYLGREIPKKVITEATPPPVRPRLPAGFDPELYLQANPDVREAGGDPIQHYLTYGIHENRPLAPKRSSPPARADLPSGFDPELYLQANPDVRKAGLDPAEHYLSHGVAEKRPLAPPGAEGGAPPGERRR